MPVSLQAVNPGSGARRSTRSSDQFLPRMRKDLLDGPYYSKPTPARAFEANSINFGPIYPFWLLSFESVHVGDYIRSLVPQLERRQSDFLTVLRENPGTTTTTIRFLSANAFNIDEFIHTSELLTHANGSEALPEQAVPTEMKPMHMVRIHYDLLLEFYRLLVLIIASANISVPLRINDWPKNRKVRDAKDTWTPVSQRRGRVTKRFIRASSLSRLQ